MIKAFAPAKINLTLHVTGQRADGYHLLDSLVAFADVGDHLWLDPAPDMSITLGGPFAAGVPKDRKNLIWQAAELAGQTLAMHLDKQLPHGAGIGGGSADAAAVLRSFGMQSDATKLGADVPVCLSSSPQRMRGIGDELSVVPSLPDFWMVLINPGVDVPTPKVFKALETKSNQQMAEQLPDWTGFEDFVIWLADQRNDLEAPARSIAPEIDQALMVLQDAAMARMSGSGATCFGLYPSKLAANEAADAVKAANPEWWVVAAKILS